LGRAFSRNKKMNRKIGKTEHAESISGPIIKMAEPDLIRTPGWAGPICAARHHNSNKDGGTE
jgi:hypothetical protein